MAKSSVEPNLLQKSIQRIAATSLGARLLVPSLHRVDRFVLRASGGRTTATAAAAGVPMLTLTTIGAKSGQVRSTPLIGIPDGDRMVLIASNFGQAHHPAWYHNLMKHPQATVMIDGRTGDYVASEAKSEEYERLWQKALALYAGYAAYKTRTGGREIPIIVLTPEFVGKGQGEGQGGMNDGFNSILKL
jgi:deazaflavin-dependent oxidoreductase (nitroreductase family)